MTFLEYIDHYRRAAINYMPKKYGGTFGATVSRTVS